MTAVESPARRNSFTSNHHESKTYEEIILEQYIDELNRSASSSRSRRSANRDPSPYAQRQSQNSLSSPLGSQFRLRPLSASSQKPRPISATLERPSSQTSQGSRSRQDDDNNDTDRSASDRRSRQSPYLSNRSENRYEFSSAPDTSGSQGNNVRDRPSSAPNHRRPLTAIYGTSAGSARPVSAKSDAPTGRYQSGPLTFTVHVYKNGSRDHSVRVAAPNLRTLLQISTKKLGFTQAARKAYLEDGTEIKNDTVIPRFANVYVSTGEPFRSPDANIKKSLEQSRDSDWTLNGVKRSNKSSRRHSRKAKKSPKTFQQHEEIPRKKILVFANRNGFGSGEIISADPNNMEEFLEICTEKFNMFAQAKIVFDWEGKRIFKLEKAVLMEPCDQIWPNVDLGPVWVSCLAGHSAITSGVFINNMIRYSKKELNKSKNYHKQLKLAQKGVESLDEQSKKKIKLKTILSLSEEEIDEAIESAERDTKLLKKVIQDLKNKLNSLKDRIEEESEHPLQCSKDHIKEIDKSQRHLLGTKGLRLRVFENGSTTNPTVVFFNLHQAIKSVDKNNKQAVLQKLLDECLQSSSHAHSATSTRTQKLFDKHGEEIKSVYELKKDQKVWLSLGEPWINPYTCTLGLRFEEISAVSIEDTKTNETTFHSVVDELGSENPALRAFMHLTSRRAVPARLLIKCTNALKLNNCPALTNAEAAWTTLLYKLKIFEVNGPAFKADYLLVETNLCVPVLAVDSDRVWLFVCISSMTDWRMIQGLPSEVPIRQISDKSSAEEQEEIRKLLETNEVDAQGWFMQHKERPNVVMCVGVVAEVKAKKNESSDKKSEPVEIRKKKKEDWPSETQTWMITEDGYIQHKSFSKLVLALSNQKLNNASQSGEQNDTLDVEGNLVVMESKSSAPNQRWIFTPDGYIANQERQDLVLTYLGGVWGLEEEAEEEEKDDDDDEEKGRSRKTVESKEKKRCYYIAACDRLSDQTPHQSQRWAIKQARLDNVGQWKHTDVKNSEWNKQALSWPVKQDGSLNKDYDWPMEGYFVPYAPPTAPPNQNLPKAATQTGSLRLRVVKNGTNDIKTSVRVVAPDISGAFNKSKKENKSKKSKHKKLESDKNHEGEEQDGTKIHCDPDVTIEQMEFNAFLNSCTQQLDLPFHARRLFDEHGQEHLSLRNLTRDQLVFVSCGEPWSDPNLSREEQKRRFLLANLASDLAQIKEFIEMRKPSDDLVLQIEAYLTAGCRVVIGQKYSGRDDLGSSQEDLNVRDSTDSINGSVKSMRSSHDISHERADELYRKNRSSRYSMEKLDNSGLDDSVDVRDSVSVTSSKSRARSLSRSLKEPADPSELQRFVYEEGFIFCLADPQLVLSVVSGEGDGGDTARSMMEEGGGRAGQEEGGVCLAKRQIDDIKQRWIINDKSIHPKFDQSLCLTVATNESNKSSHLRDKVNTAENKEDARSVPYVGQTLLLQRKKTVQYGAANQRWRYDSSTKHIYAFAADKVDKEITAANKVNVCTFAVMGRTAIEQVGYVVVEELGGDKKKFSVDRDDRVVVCGSCARAMRDRYKLIKLNNNIKFYCSMADAKSYGLKQVGTFKCLNGKVDLSTHEAEATLKKWKAEYAKLKKELNLRRVIKGISSAPIPYTVRVRAYRNGEGRNKKHCQIILGSSIPGILQQATEVLGLYTAARRVYTADGTLILDIDDLIKYMKSNTVTDKREKEIKQQTEKDIENKTSDSDAESLSDDSLKGSERKTDVEEHLIGFDVLNNRQFIDEETSCIIIPNPEKRIPFDGKIVSWQLFAKHDGMLALNVYRPVSSDDDSDSTGRFILIGQSVCELTEGELMIDISTKPLSVKRGDVIGFHIINNAILPYDIVEGPPTPFYYLMTDRNPPIGGDPLNMDVSQEDGSRAYSLQAKIIHDKLPDEVDNTRKKKKVKKQKKKKEVTFGDTQTMETSSVKSSRSSLNSYEEKDSEENLEALLRQPMKVFISCGEDFIDPEKAVKDQEAELRKQGEMVGLSRELDKEKHVLRQMRGRRFEDIHSPALIPTGDDKNPILVDRGWTDQLNEEKEKSDLISKLQAGLKEIKSHPPHHAVKPFNTNTINRLYPQPKTKRLLVFANGDKLESAQFAWGETYEQLLDNSTMRLNMNAPARYLFTLSGKLVENFSELSVDQIICASSSRRFIPPEETQHLMRTKANWARQNKMFGRKSTDIVVETKRNYRHEKDYLCSRGTPQLVLTLTDQKVRGHPGHPQIDQCDLDIEGYIVSLLPKEEIPAQKWHFTADGYICAKEKTDLVLTYVKSSEQVESRGGIDVGRGIGVEPGEGYCLAACKRLNLKENPYQRSGKLLNDEETKLESD